MVKQFYLSISDLFALPLNVKQFYLTYTTLWSDVNKGVLCIPQSSSITGAFPSDCLMSYPEDLSGVGSYLSAAMQSVFSTVPANWADLISVKTMKPNF